MKKRDLKIVFNYLLGYFNNEDVVWECIYLYRYLVGKHKEDNFYSKINKLPKNISKEYVKEYVKAETHDIDMKFLLNIDDVNRVIEVRRFLEDIDVKSEIFEECYSIYYEMARHPFMYSTILYEIRRFLKYGYPTEMLHILRTFKESDFKICLNSKICVFNDWKIVNLILEKCIRKEKLDYENIKSIIIDYYMLSDSAKIDTLFKSYLV